LGSPGFRQGRGAKRTKEIMRSLFEARAPSGKTNIEWRGSSAF
jgi:hypothetical protein